MGDQGSLAGIGAFHSRKARRISASHHGRLGRDTAHYCDHLPSSYYVNLRPLRICRSSTPSIRLQIGGKHISSRTGSPRYHGVGHVAPQG